MINNAENIKESDNIIEAAAGSEIPVYSSVHLLDKETHYDFNNISYRKFNVPFFIYVCFVTVMTVESLFTSEYRMILFFAFLSLLMLIMNACIGKSVKDSYKRILVSEGKEPEITVRLFDDKVRMEQEDTGREYTYGQVSGLYETKRTVLLHLQLELYVVIEKSSLDADVDEVKEFLLSKCTAVKKKKFINCANYRKLSRILSVILLAVTVTGTLAALIMQTV